MGKIVKIILALLMVGLMVAGTLTGLKTGEQVVYPLAYVDYIDKYAQENDLDRYLVMAVIHTESDFVPEAHSGLAGGLMQLTEETAQWIAQRKGLEYHDYMDPETNVMLGCYYLKYLIDTYGVIDTALAAYNGGMGNVYKWLEDPNCSDAGKTLKYIPFTETRNYVTRVNDAWVYYRDNYEKIKAVNEAVGNIN